MKVKPPGDATRMDLSGSPAGLPSGIRTWDRPTLQPPQALVGEALGQFTEQEGNRKTFEKGKEGCKTLLHTQERQAVRDNGIAPNPEVSLGILF